MEQIYNELIKEISLDRTKDIIFIVKNPNINGTKEEIKKIMEKFGVLCKRFSEKDVDSFIYSKNMDEDGLEIKPIYLDQSQVDINEMIDNIPDDVQTITIEELKRYLTKPLLILEEADKQALIEGNYQMDGIDVIVYMNDKDIESFYKNSVKNSVIILEAPTTFA